MPGTPSRSPRGGASIWVPGPNWRRELDVADERIGQLEPEWKRAERLAELKWKEASRRLQ